MSPPRVLVIEDDPDVSALLARHFRELGCPVAAAYTGEEGLDLAFADPPDIAVVDMMLPGIDGREVIRRMRADERTTGCHVVVSTVLDKDEVRDLADDLLAKPFRQSSVARLVSSYRSSVSGSSVPEEE
ncbi:response regulator [Streptomyces sp. HUCO-GS316]|uniref:response regulator transcription factor n=1 Tax=Streptomyces sp. HUCO-GS316 TaxID=2692198 RepID=UPI001369A3E6|nr:response regulator [Streptomyces sp. HUCO-GS316]MXM64893.1 response regulator [Streptomyces sp. HUCO-GS316]